MFLFLRRFLARVFDYGLFYFITVFIALAIPFEIEGQMFVLWALVVPFVWAPFEAILLKAFQTTSGKRLFGIYVPLLSLRQSFKRAFFMEKPRSLLVHPIGFKRYVIALILTCCAGSVLFMGEGISEAAVQYEQQVTEAGWIQYISDDGKFKIQFPKKPEQASKQFNVPQGEPLNLNEFKAHKEADFSVSYLELPKKWRLFGSNTLLKGAMKVILEHTPRATLLEKNWVKHKDYPAMDFRIQEGENLIEGRLILVGNTLYKLWVVYFPDTPRDMQHETFLQSFEITS